jgi:hypothetical protein
MQLPVNVLRQDIEDGIQGAARKCAVALAVRHLFPWAQYTAATYDYVFVSERVATDLSGNRHFVGRQETWALDRVGSEMVSDFDQHGRAAIPRSFNITRDYSQG